MTENNGVLLYGGVTDSAVSSSIANFSGAALNAISRCTTPIEHLSNDENDNKLAHASGFFWARNNRVFLVSNWHVFSGRNPLTGKVLSNQGYVPRRLRFYGQNLRVEGNQVLQNRLHWTLEFDDNLIELLSDPPVVDGESVDVFAIPLADGVVNRERSLALPNGRFVDASAVINDHANQRIQTLVGDDCFIVGYPLANYEGGMLPIWRSGSIASDTLLGLGEKPAFLIDASVTPAMSGSAIIRKSAPIAMMDQDQGFIQETAAYELVGIYAGRLQNADLERTNLGYGWHKTLIESVIDAFDLDNAPTLTSGQP